MAAELPTAAFSTTLPRVALVFALAAENSALQVVLGRHPEAAVVSMQSGPGAERSGQAARQLVASGACALISWGLAGGLEPEAAPGSLIIPRRVIGLDGRHRATDAAWRTRLLQTLHDEFLVQEGDLLEIDHVLATPREKAHAARETGSVAVDMESAAIAAVAETARLPFLALRVVIDGVADTLPERIEAWVTPDGQSRWLPAAATLLKPGEWGTLARLVQRHRTAQRTLGRLAGRLVPTGFEFSRRS